MLQRKENEHGIHLGIYINVFDDFPWKSLYYFVDMMNDLTNYLNNDPNLEEKIKVIEHLEKLRVITGYNYY